LPALIKPVTLHRRIVGDSDAPNLIILHGLLGSADNWLTLAKQYSEKFQVHLVDARNHGRSPKSESHSYPAMAEDLLAYLNEHEIEKTALIGHSMGGKTAMTFAEKHPERVTKLIIADIAPRAYLPHHDHIFEALQKTSPENATSREEVLESLKLSLGSDSVLIQFLMKSLRREKSGGFSWRFNVDVLSNTIHRITEKIDLTVNTLPTLFIYGRESEYVKESDISEVEDLYLQIETACLENSGHWLHAQEPELFFEITSEFLG
jgi:pimeloyl-ACP methyl ester carboxylesterase